MYALDTKLTFLYSKCEWDKLSCISNPFHVVMLAIAFHVKLEWFSARDFELLVPN